MYIVLTEDLSTGNPEIDPRNQRILDRVNAIAMATESTMVGAAVESLLHELQRQFAAEERVMNGLGCSWSHRHAREHRALESWVEQLSHSAHDGRNPVSVQLELFDGVERRLLRHIRKADGRLARWLERQRKKRRGSELERALWSEAQELAAK